jgi:hypothetical protein
MQRVLPIELAIFLHFDPLAVVVAVLGRDVVAALAHLALQRDLDPSVVLGQRSLLLIAAQWAAARSTIVVAVPGGEISGSGGGTRTRDNTIMSRVL